MERSVSKADKTSSRTFGKELLELVMAQGPLSEQKIILEIARLAESSEEVMGPAIKQLLEECCNFGFILKESDEFSVPSFESDDHSEKPASKKKKTHNLCKKCRTMRSRKNTKNGAKNAVKAQKQQKKARACRKR